MKRQLASIQKIEKLEPIEGADRIEKATILGWELVVVRGEFNEGDSCVYCEVDSILPEKEEFEFLRKRKFRIRTIKLKKQVSQGIAFPLSILPSKAKKKAKIGQNVTDILGIKIYEKPLPFRYTRKPYVAHWYEWFFPKFIARRIRWYLKRGRKGLNRFPRFIPKTDEMRIQAVPKVLERHKGKTFYVTEKVDGSSMTVYYNKKKFGVCSRNFELPKDKENQFWIASIEHNLENKLKNYCKQVGKNLAIQGELLGMNVQGNKYKFTSYRYLVYNIFDINKQEYLDFEDFKSTVKFLNLTPVPVIDTNFVLNHTVKELVEYSKGKSIYSNCPHREGIVLRPLKEERDYKLGRLSFKAINPDFLLKYGE